MQLNAMHKEKRHKNLIPKKIGTSAPQILQILARTFCAHQTVSSGKNLCPKPILALESVWGADSHLKVNWTIIPWGGLVVGGKPRYAPIN